MFRWCYIDNQSQWNTSCTRLLKELTIALEYHLNRKDFFEGINHSDCYKFLSDMVDYRYYVEILKPLEMEMDNIIFARKMEIKKQIYEENSQLSIVKIFVERALRGRSHSKYNFYYDKFYIKRPEKYFDQRAFALFFNEEAKKFGTIVRGNENKLILLNRFHKGFLKHKLMELIDKGLLRDQICEELRVNKIF